MSINTNFTISHVSQLKICNKPSITYRSKLRFNDQNLLFFIIKNN